MTTPTLPFKVKTAVSWAGEEEGDLGFIENEIVEVLSIVDESWWNGKLRRNGAEGIFPKDYVEIIEDSMIQSASTQSLSKLSMPQKTPIKEEYDQRLGHSKSNTPINGYNSHRSSFSPKKGKNDSFQDVSFGNDEDFNYKANLSYDNIEFANRSKIESDHNFKKTKSSSQLVSSLNHPKNKYLRDLQGIEREKEIENFKLLKQQHDYNINRVDQQKRFSPQSSEKHHRSSEAFENIYSSPGRANLQTRSNPQLVNPSSYHSSPTNKKSHSQNDISFEQRKSDMLFKNRTIESFSPEGSKLQLKCDPVGFASSNQIGEEEFVDEYEEILFKRKQLEMELQYLKKLEKLNQMKKIKSLKSSPTSTKQTYNKAPVYDADSSYLSEDLTSSKKNYHSADDLSRKLNSYITDEINDISEPSDEDECGSSPPPPPPKHTTPIKSYNDHEGMQNSYNSKITPLQRVPYDADDFQFSGQSDKKLVQLTEEEFLRLSQLRQSELKNSIKSMQSDVLNLSELSATSAGSFIRHKFEREQNDLKMKSLSKTEEIPATEQVSEKKDMDRQFIDSIFQDKKSRHPNIFKKLLHMKKTDDNMNNIERKLQTESEVDWTTFKMELNRMNTLTSQDKQGRTKRVLREAGPFIVKPLDYISDINRNEILGEFDNDTKFTINNSLFDKINLFIDNYPLSSDLNELISDVSVKFNSSKLNQLRCILVHLCKFQIIEEAGTISQSKPKLNEVISKGEASIFQLNYLFKKLLDALRIPSEVVLGFWKKPNEFYHNDQYLVNHSWLSVLIENHFLIIDLYCFKNGSLCNIRDSPRGFNEFYFLAKPLNIVSTHISSIVDLQHIVPPVDQNVCFHLPRAYSGFYKSKLRFDNFNNALTIMKDTETFELDIDIPIDIELFTLVKTAKVTTNDLSLCQIYWENNKRIAKIKAILPQKESIGVLQVFAGPKGLQKHFDNVHELAIVIPLQHSGSYKPSKFVPRFPTVQSQNNDLYIKQPQTSTIIARNSYNFNILQFPSQGLNSGSGIMNQEFKLVIESPSGKYFKLIKQDPLKPYGLFETNIKCQEIGLYRGLVIGDNGNSWYVFAQWECVPNNSLD